jgi:hypothetical protein
MSGLRPPGKRAKEKEATFGLNKKKGEEYNRRKKERKKRPSAAYQKNFLLEKRKFDKENQYQRPFGPLGGQDS